jgi:succinoglycan biosynthesis transport protein ExoP
MSNSDLPALSANDGPLINWQYLWMMATRHYKLFFAVFIPVVGLTIAYLVVTKPVYESTATVQVQAHLTGSIANDPASSNPEESLTSDDAMKTIEQNMQSYDLFMAMAKDPDLVNDPDFLVGYHGNQPPTTNDIADWLRGNSKVALRHGSRLIDITFYHRVPAMAQKLAEAIVTTYVQLGATNQSNGNKMTVQLLDTESKSVKDKLQNAEQSLETYKDLLDLATRIDTQRSTVDSLRERYREKHPQMIQARALMAELNQEFDDQFQKTVQNPVNQSAVQFDPNEAKAALDDRVTAEIQYVQARTQVSQKEVDTDSQLLSNLETQLGHAAVNSDDSATAVTLANPPELPTKPSKPKKTIILLLGFSMGAFLGIGAVIGVRAIDSTIDTPMEAEAALGLPVIGTILRATGKKKGPAPPSAGTVTPPRSSSVGNAPLSLSEEMVVATDPGSATAEGFRSLRAVVNLLGKPADHRIILFTSALPGEGKTYVSCNYALSLAMTGVRTLLIDTDLRRPAVHERLKLDNRVGLVEILDQDVPLNQVVHSKVSKNFDVLTAGGACNNPAELLAGDGFRQLLVKALTQYDRIVVDTGPVNLVSDCLLIAPEVNMVCFVLRAGSTARQAPKHAIALLRRAQKEPTGIILNAIPPGSDKIYLGYKGRSGVGSYGNVYN